MGLRISIVTATYNRRDYIGRCIESVAGQPYVDMEHIIVDGGSTDGTVDVIRQYAQRYPHIRWISALDNGISDAFNKGLALMTGDVVGIIGDDDFYEPDVFSLIATEFTQHPEAGVVAGHCALVQTDRVPWRTLRANFTNRSDLIKCWKHWGRSTMLPAPSSFIRRAVIQEIGGFEVADRYAMDYHHWIKITEKFNVRIVDRVLANFRYETGTISYSRQKQQWKETLAISRRYWGSPLHRQYYSFLCSFLIDYKARKSFAWLRQQVGRVGRAIGRVRRGEGLFPKRT